jgi:8-oxo-dGTP pyrophosphatase MutT (NUDIX family)
MVTTSAGILLYRTDPDGTVSALVAHMGGPFWARKDEGAWSIPKGEFDPQVEAARDAAAREFREELGVDPPEVPYVELGTFAYSSGRSPSRCSVATARIPRLRCRPRRARVRRVRDGVAAAVGTPSELSRDRPRGLDAARRSPPRLVAGQRPALDACERLMRKM